MKVEVQNHKCSINESSYSHEQIIAIWEFYVTKSIAKTASQKRTLADYGLPRMPWKEMMDIADLKENTVKIVPANSIRKTLEKFDLEITEGEKNEKHNKAIEIDIPKIACLTPYSIADEDPPKPKFGDAESVLTHIRNALAHGNTYFFDNGYLMLEDRDGSSGEITARMILKQKTLLDWIGIIDSKHKFYK